MTSADNILAGLCPVAGYKDPTSSLTFFAITRADCRKPLCFDETGAWRDQRASRTQSNLMRGSLSQSCPCSGKASLSSTSQPLPLSAALNLDVSHAGELHNPTLGGNPRVLTKTPH